jgi:hypothetical protein
LEFVTGVIVCAAYRLMKLQEIKKRVGREGRKKKANKNKDTIK